AEFFFSSRRRHTSFSRDWSSDVCSSDLDAMLAYGREAAERGLRVIIAGAGGAAHLPGMLAAVTPLPVIGVPVPLRHLDGMDSLRSEERRVGKEGRAGWARRHARRG